MQSSHRRICSGISRRGWCRYRCWRCIFATSWPAKILVVNCGSLKRDGRIHSRDQKESIAIHRQIIIWFSFLVGELWVMLMVTLDVVDVPRISEMSDANNDSYVNSTWCQLLAWVLTSSSILYPCSEMSLLCMVIKLCTTMDSSEPWQSAKNVQINLHMPQWDMK